LPVCEDPETIEILAKAVNEWDSDVNDGLIRLSDRNLVSDYVFLTMRQLKAVLPTDMDAGKRLRGFAGLSCIHCHDHDEQASPAGRSFPSAPDNYASALNSSFYNHMQNCLYIPSELKRALANTRKIHSVQCSSLRFGSQRRYFNMLFVRLESFKTNLVGVDVPLNDFYETTSTALSTRTGHASLDCSDFGFLEVPAADSSRFIHFCLSCRMIPIQFRAEGSVLRGKPSPLKMKQHCGVCLGDEFDLTSASAVLEEAIRVYCNGDNTVILCGSFRDLVHVVMGRNAELTKVMTEDIEAIIRRRAGRRVEEDADVDLPNRSKGLWRHFPSEVDFSEVDSAFDRFASDRFTSGLGIQQYPILLGFLQLISPGLVVPTVSIDEKIATATISPPISGSGSLLHGLLQGPSAGSMPAVKTDNEEDEALNQMTMTKAERIRRDVQEGIDGKSGYVPNSQDVAEIGSVSGDPYPEWKTPKVISNQETSRGKELGGPNWDFDKQEGGV
jgi:hypothetical protein